MRRIAAVGLTLLLTGCGEHRLPPPPVVPPPVEMRPLADVTVVLDPGHGGEDPGAVVGMVREAALTYRAAVEVARALRDEGATVVFTVKNRMLDPALVDLPMPPDAPTDALLLFQFPPAPRPRLAPSTLRPRRRRPRALATFSQPAPPLFSVAPL